MPAKDRGGAPLLQAQEPVTSYKLQVSINYASLTPSYIILTPSFSHNTTSGSPDAGRRPESGVWERNLDCAPQASLHPGYTGFPEYRATPLVGILASLAVEESVSNYAEKTGFVVLATGDQVMEVKNRPAFEPKRW